MKQSLRIDVNPVPASRPRVSRFGTYYGPIYRKFKAMLATTLQQMGVNNFFGKDPIEVEIECHIKRPKTTTLEMPRGDVDNYAKGVMDALNGVLWDDDVQIQKLTVTKQFASPDSDGFIIVEVSDKQGSQKVAVPKLPAVRKRRKG